MKYSDAIKDKIREDYLSGTMTVEAIAKKYNCGQSLIYTSIGRGHRRGRGSSRVKQLAGKIALANKALRSANGSWDRLARAVRHFIQVLDDSSVTGVYIDVRGKTFRVDRTVSEEGKIQ